MKAEKWTLYIQAHIQFSRPGGVLCCLYFKVEIDNVLLQGVDAARIIYSHPIKQKSHLKHAAETGIDMTVFDNVEELDKIKEIHPKSKYVAARFLQIFTIILNILPMRFTYMYTIRWNIELRNEILDGTHFSENHPRGLNGVSMDV